MRFLTLLYALYVLLLPMVPCADGAAEGGNAVAMTSVQIEQGQGQVATETEAPDDHEEDHCSPFCACACCYSQPAQPVHYRSVEPTALEAACPCHSCPALSDKPTHRPYNIWQPPRQA